MLQGRSTPSGGMMPAVPSNGHHQYTTSAPRGGGGYRGSTVPVQSYAFAPTPNLNQSLQWQQYGAYRTNSSPSGIPTQTFDPSLVQRSHRPNPSVTNMALAPAYHSSHGSSHGSSHSSGQSSGHSSHGSSHGSSGTRDDTAKSPSRNATSSSSSRPQLVSAGSLPTLPSSGTPKYTPDRYRRPSNSGSQHTRSQSTNPPLSPGSQAQMYHAPSGSRSVPNLTASPSRSPGASMDDSHLNRRPSPDEAKKMRRRSVHTIQSTDSFRPLLKPENSPRLEQTAIAKSEKSPQAAQRMPLHARKGSSDSASSGRSVQSPSASSSNRNAAVSTSNPSSPAADETSTKSDQLKAANIPPRGSSADGVKRTLSPSPLSKPATMANEPAGDATPAAAATTAATSSQGKTVASPAAKQLAAINEKDVKGKTKTSRLRRAFSFGSAAEFRKAAGPDGEGMERVEASKLRKDPTADEAYDAEQARIAEAQEAAGIGNNIYGGRFFGGSTDNLSISSTASSASIMIRKMGRGMKKSTRSLVGLFRPKSAVGMPAADTPVSEAGQAAVSMITVEAETRRVNVTADPQGGKGGTGFPRLERNSIDATQIPEGGAERAGSSGADNGPRKSIVGGEKERAEVLAAVRKGILKRPGSSSPSIRPSESPDLVLPNIPNVADSPNSSAPSTPNDDGKRSNSIAIGNEDYFMSALRLGKSRPGTPQAGPKRNATFSPRIIFYDTWPSQEYDRRGEIATCNRLTPMLAQQIKEELNSFKMEMEVHENSKIYTHFF
ncbi:hypothetical protein TgHK011_006197 [Trichoderma gracile]|nr:hypothetical protein TgHK011_006197 [Trichoderma gracile]